ncbi:hypothetical protein, conserved [Eimeria brunetti]|uniref:Uncharacterized protein n=1 Tax=Eimeria brunetti TaxID=51314 RepID=U6LC15_9EIME|nr:hypothetical protein, conserved [Eimeria brunetti]
MKGQRALDPSAAAAAAVRRLGSDRPLFAVSLSTAVSQLLQLTPIPESAADCCPSQIPSFCISPRAGDDAIESDSLRAEDKPVFGRAGGNQQREENTLVDTDQKGTDARQMQWLTGRFIAQVRTHFEATLAASCEKEGEAPASGGEEAQVSEGEEEETIKHQKAVCSAAFNWGLLLLLSAESALLAEPTPQLTPKTTAEGSPNQQNKSLYSPEISRLEAEAVKSNQNDKAESADSILREALFAFEIVIRVSPLTATRVLPKVLEWIDWGLSRTRGHHALPSGENETDTEHIRFLVDALQNAETGGWEGPVERRAQQIRRGSLSALFSCPIPNCVASGRIFNPSEHLSRVRLLTLLLRGNRVLLGCSRVLAACVVSPRGARGVCEGDSSNCMRGTAPENKIEGENTKAAAEAEASVQRQLCAETVGQLHAAMKDLRAALFPGAHTEQHQLSRTLQLEHGEIESLSRAEKMILAACLPPVLRWVGAPLQHSTGGSQAGNGSAASTDRYTKQNFSWAFAGTDFSAAEDAPQKAAVYLLATIQGLLLSFALKIQGSSKCADTFGVAAAAAEESVVQQAQALLKEIGEFFSLPPNASVDSHSLGLPSGTFIHAVTGFCSRALTAKELPKAFQMNANRADSRILLTTTAASSVVKVQIAERGGARDPRCPLTGRLQLPQGLPDEQLIEVFSRDTMPGGSAMHGGPDRGFLSYLSDEGAFRMAIHVSRIMIALAKSTSLVDEERSLGFIVPPLLRILDVPQAEVRFLGWKCLSEIVVNYPRGALNNYRTPITQALMGGFPIYIEVDVCFDAYLEAFTKFICRTFTDQYDQSFFDCQNFLIDMCHPALNSSESLRSVFLRRSRDLLIFAGDSANLRLCDWMSQTLEALESVSLEAIEEGLQTLKVLLPIGIDIEEFLPQILCRLATIAVVAKEKSAPGYSGPQTRLADLVELVAHQLVCSADNELLRTICTKVTSHFQEWRSDEPSLVHAITEWLSWFSSLLRHERAEA